MRRILQTGRLATRVPPGAISTVLTPNTASHQLCTCRSRRTSGPCWPGLVAEAGRVRFGQASWLSVEQHTRYHFSDSATATSDPELAALQAELSAGGLSDEDAQALQELLHEQEQKGFGERPSATKSSWPSAGRNTGDAQQEAGMPPTWTWGPPAAGTDNVVQGVQPNWTWSQPTPKRRGRGESPIPIIPRQELTTEEIVAALRDHGNAIDVEVVDTKGKTDLCDAMVFATGLSQLHMQRMADIVVYALKKRKLREALGVTGAEGYDCTDWMLVDCNNIIVHFMTARTRKDLDMENRWRNVRPNTYHRLEGGTGGEDKHIVYRADDDENYDPRSSAELEEARQRWAERAREKLGARARERGQRQGRSSSNPGQWAPPVEHPNAAASTGARPTSRRRVKVGRTVIVSRSSKAKGPSGLRIQKPSVAAQSSNVQQGGAVAVDG